MTPLDSFLFLGVTVAFLWVMWLLLNFVFDCIDDYYDAWREARYASADRRSREAVSPDGERGY